MRWPRPLARSNGPTNRRKQFRRSASAYWPALAGAVGFLLATVAFHGPTEPQHWANDLIIKAFSQRNLTPNQSVAMVLIDDDTLAKHPYISPIDRKLLASLICILDHADVKAIGLDFVFNRKTDDDELFKKVINSTATARVVVGVLDERTPVLAAENQFQEDFVKAVKPADKHSHGHLYFDEEHSSSFVIGNHVIRLIAKSTSAGLPSFAEALANREFEPGQDQYISWLLPPRDGNETFPSWSAKALLNDHDADHFVTPDGCAKPAAEQRANELKRYFTGRTVLIGGDFHDRDLHFTPLSVLSNERYPGVSIHAQIVAQLLDQKARRLNSLHGLPQLGALAMAFLTGLLVGWRCHLGLWDFLLELLVILAVINVTVMYFQTQSVLLPSTLLIISGLAGAAFGRYIPKARH